ncbi:LolA-like protein [Streptomyces sp. S6]
MKRAGIWAAAVAVLVGTVACTQSGDGSRAPGPLTALRGAERSTREAHSARVESSTEMGELMSLTAEGAVSWSGGLTGTLVLTYTGGSVAKTMRAAGTPSTEARYLPDAYYARLGTRLAAQVGGRHWVRYGYDDLARLPGGAGSYIQDQLRHTAPNRSVKLLLDSKDVREVGRETVRGRRTTHYSGSVDSDASNVTTERVDVWVDERNLLVKKVERGVTANGAYSQTAYYSEYGTKVAARRPAAADTAEFSELVRELSRS